MLPGCSDDDVIGSDSLTEAPVEYQKLIKQRRKVSFGFVFGALIGSPKSMVVNQKTQLNLAVRRCLVEFLMSNSINRPKIAVVI